MIYDVRIPHELCSGRLLNIRTFSSILQCKCKMPDFAHFVSLPKESLLGLIQPRHLFVYFRSFQTQCYRKNFRLQRDTNWDRRSRRQAR